MIDLDKRNAIYLMHQEGISFREISRRLHPAAMRCESLLSNTGD